MDDTISGLEKRECELIEMLAKTQIGTESYDKIVDELEQISRMKNAELQTDNTRLNNNERNDIDRKKIDVDVERIKVEKWKINAGLIDSGFDLVKCLGFSWIAYNGEKVSYAIKQIMDVGKGFLRRRH